MTNHVYCRAAKRADNAEAYVVVPVVSVVVVPAIHLAVVVVVVPAAATVIAVVVVVGIPTNKFFQWLTPKIYPADFDFQRNPLSFLP